MTSECSTLGEHIDPLISAIYRLRAPEECVRHFAQVLAKIIPGEAHACVIRSVESDQRAIGLEPATAEHPVLLEEFFPLISEYPPAMHRQATATHEALTISDFVSARDFEDRGIFHLYYRRVGLRDDLSATFQHGSTTGCVAVARGRRTFRAEERVVLNRLRPHFQQAYANALEFAGAGIPVTADGVARLDGEWSQALVMVRLTDGRIEHCSDRAAAVLSAFFSAKPGATRLPGVIGRWLECYRREDPGTSPVLRITENGRRLAVRALHDTARQRAVLFLEEKTTVPTDALAALASARLTARELEVLSWLAQGKANGEIAIILGLRPATVKVHLENIYRKLGVENRASAIILALKAQG